MGRLLGPSRTKETGKQPQGRVRSHQEGSRDEQEARTGGRAHVVALAREEPGNDHRRETQSDVF